VTDLEIAQEATIEVHAVGRRHMVPTDRQRARGVGPARQRSDRELTGPEDRAPATAAIDAPASPLTRRQAARDALRQLNPRGVAGDGPVLPVLAAASGTFFGRADDAAFGILLLAMQRDLHFAGNALLFVGQVTAVFVFLLSPVGGFIADRLKRVRLAAFGELFSNLTVLACGFVGGVGMLSALRLFNGLGGVLKNPVQAPLMADYYPPRDRGRVYAFIAGWGFLGAVAGPLGCSAVASAFGWRVALVGLGVLGSAASLLWWFLREPVRGRLERLELGADDETANREQPPLSWGEGWRAAASIGTIRRLWYAAPFMQTAGTLLPLLFLLNFRVSFGLTIFQLGLLGVMSNVVSYAALLYAGPLVQRFVDESPSRIFAMLAAAMAFTVVALYVVFLGPVLWVSLLGVVLVNLMTSVIVPASVTLISLVVPPRIRGFGLSTTGPWSFIGTFLAFVLIQSYGLNYVFLLVVAPSVFLAGAAILATGSATLSRDIRAARAVALADEELRRRQLEHADAPVLLCRDVQLAYGGTQVLFGIDLDISDGEMIALLGTNGAGKSTLLRAITGVNEATGGAVFFGGLDITHKPPHEIARLGVVFMPGGRAVFPNLTVDENLRAAAWADPDPASTAARVDRVFEHFPELVPARDRQAGKLSGGEQQMVALGQALVMKPRILLIDELSLGLAPAVVERLLDIVRAINAQGTTVVLVEQSVNVALVIARRAIFMDKGEIRFDGEPRELLRRGDLVRSVFFEGAASAAGGPVLATGGAVTARRAVVDDDAGRLALEGVDLSYGGHGVLDQISFALDPGRICGVIGPNGAGKTSLLDVISGYVRADAGRVLLGTADVSGLPPDARARLGLTRSFQNARLFTYLTVRENIAVALEQHVKVRSATAAALWLPAVRRSEARVRRRVEWLIELLHLEAYADKFVNELSVGTRRMVDMACIMAAEPKVLLLDEPSSGVAQAEIEVFAPVVQRLARDTGCSILVIEHDLPLVTAMSDRLLVIELGRLIADGEPREVLDRPEVIAAYLAGADPSTIHRSGAGQPTTSEA
jgi:ABC-type branched-subunit amino acid transport system ATPase component/predicted MFS family arabinose efflux permease